MKKGFSCLICAFIVLNFLFVGVNAEEKNNDIFATSEPMMPSEIHTTRSSYSREQWVEDIIEYNENHYEQEVSSWYETEDAYVFEFEQLNNNSTLSINISNSDDVFLGIHKIEYIKPESDLTLTVNGTTYVDKFTYYYGFSGSYVSIDSQRKASYEALRSISIKIASTIWQPAGEIMELVTGVAETLYDFKKPAYLQTFNQYFYYNKVCSIRATNETTWYPTCQIGKRYAFTLEEHKVMWSNGYLDEKQTQTYHWDGYSVPPKTGQFVEPLTKPHYEDGRWMIEKAISTKNTGGYVDVYGLAPNPHN